MKGLEPLSITCDKLTTLPESIGEIKKLSSLSLSIGNYPTLFPESLEKLENLKVLYLDDITATSSDSISRMKSLVKIETTNSHDEFEFPKAICEIKKIFKPSLTDVDELHVSIGK